MRLRAVAGIILRQAYLIRGSPVRVLPMFAWVAIDIVLWGFITRYLDSVSGSGINFVSTLLGAVLLWDLFTRIMQGITTAFLEDVWSRNFLNLFATPLSIAE
ncbi:MAG: ABC transporter permease, partial [Gammaproteobacteria bacterium]|nr:ABC transporter permease [Gammaproteobacteria bacterium]